jgi:hypothetical protein
LVTSPSQLPKPAAHVVIAHVPVLHEVAVAFVKPMHSWLSPLLAQPPQFVSVRVSISQPFASMPSQSSKPASQVVISQVVPPAHATADVLASVLQLTPQPPQLLTVLVGVSQPLR